MVQGLKALTSLSADTGSSSRTQTDAYNLLQFHSRNRTSSSHLTSSDLRGIYMHTVHILRHTHTQASILYLHFQWAFHKHKNGRICKL